MCTGSHDVYDATRGVFCPVLEAVAYPEFYSLNDLGKEERVFFSRTNDLFSVLDVEVEDTHSYFTCGVLSHNSTFGGAAKAMSEGLRKLNILCSNHDTSMIVISQERANMCVSETTEVEWGWFLGPGATKTSTVKELFVDRFHVDLDSLPVLEPIDVRREDVVVLGYDEAARRNRLSRVLRIVKKPKSSRLRVVVKGHVVEVGSRHLFGANDHWVEASALSVGDELRLVDEAAPIDSIEVIDDAWIYDLETELGNYYANGVLSHNTPMSHLPATCVTPDTVVDVIETK